jgi:hypothetical protein
VFRLSVNGKTYNPTSVKDFWPRANRSDGYEGSWVEFPDFYYCVWMTIDGKSYAVDGRATRYELAKHIRNGRKIAAQHPDVPFSVGYQKIWTTTRELLCPWCGVRPDKWEWDCDGHFPMSTCGSEQCDKLNRCQGCGRDGEAHINHLCDSCYEIRTGRTVPQRRR